MASTTPTPTDPDQPDTSASGEPAHTGPNKTLVAVAIGAGMVVCLLAGYALGSQRSDSNPVAQSGSSSPASATTSPGACGDGDDSDGTCGVDGATDTTKPENPAAEEMIESMTWEEIQAQLKPGTGPSAPVALADGTFDAHIVGGRGEVRTREDALNVHRRDPNDPFAIGAIDAPVVISEFSDLECPFCARFANTTKADLIAKYVDSGYVRLEFNDLPINGPHAEQAAAAARAAAAQGKFEEFITVLFAASADTPGHPDNSLEDFQRFAREAGVADIDLFTQQITDGTYADDVAKAKDYAIHLGVSSTPSFLIGTTLVSGALPTENFETVIELELTKVAKGAVTPLPPQK